MTSSSLLLKNAHVATVNGIIQTNIAVTSGKISAIGSLSDHKADNIIDCTGLHILPGVIDTQVHLREPGNEHKEDLETGGKSAIAGGVTSVFEMPNTNPSTTTAEALRDKLARAKGRMYTDHAFYIGATASNIHELADLEKMEGCAGIKIFMGSSTGDLLVADDSVLEQVLRSGHRRIAIHAEDEARLIERKDIATKGSNATYHPDWRDVTTALLATKRIVALAQKTKRKIHVLHISTAEEMVFLADYKDLVTVEVLVNHLTLTAPECYEKLGTLAQMNPPIRDARHRQALWQAVFDGTVDILATDHAPHTLEEKARPYPNSPSGMTGLQTLVPIMLDHIHHGRLSLERFVDLCCHAPARVFGLRRKGFIRIGYDADFTIVDLKKRFTVRNQDMHSKCGWTPFDGMELVGKPVMTIIRGNIVMDNDEIIGKADGKPLEFDIF